MQSRYDINRWYLPILILAFIVLLCAMPLLKINSLHSTVFDFGIYNQLFWDLSSNCKFQKIFYGHAQPLIIVEALLYKLFPSYYTMIIIQSCILSSGLYFIKLFSKNFTKLSALRLSIVFMLYFPLWYLALFDFHVDHLLVPLLFLFYHACFANNWWLAVLSALLIALVKEPFALVSAFCGIYLFIRWRKFWNGIFVLLFGTVYFYIATSILIPHYTEGIKLGFEGEAFAWLGNSALNIVCSVIAHPIDIMVEIFCNHKKVYYLTAIFGALSFIPIFSPKELLPAVPILGISLLSRSENYYGIAHHYTAGIIAPMIISYIVGYPKAEKYFLILTKKIILKENAIKIFACSSFFIIIFIHIMVSPSPASRLFFSNKVWSYGAQAYIPNYRDAVIKAEIKRYIPPDPNVLVSTQNTLNCSYLAKRNHYSAFPIGATKPFLIPKINDGKNNRKSYWANYVVIDLKRPWYIGDQGCNRQSDEALYLSNKETTLIGLLEKPDPLKWVGCLSKELKTEFIDSIAETKKRYKKLYEFDGFMILKRE